MDDHKRRMLGAFLRTRRERLTPQQAGVRAGGRRRTPGLRREEVAQLAGVSVTWYTWIEQGRAVGCTAEVLQSIARALQLPDHETAYLLALAGVPAPGAALAHPLVSPQVQRLLDHQGLYPAYLMGRWWELLAWNRATAPLFGDLALLAPSDRNMLWYTFTAPYARQTIIGWELRARRLLAEFRADCGQYLTEPAPAELIARLQAASPEFARWWPQHDLQTRAGGRREFLHPRAGLLVFEQLTLHPSTDTALKLVVHLPLDATEGRLQELLEARG